MQEEIKEKLCLQDDNSEDINMLEEYDYSKFKNLDGFDLDSELLGKFAPVAKRLHLSQDSVETLLDIALEMSKRQDKKRLEDDEVKQKNKLADYYKKFCEDDELPNPNSDNLREFMQVACFAYHEFASPELKETFKKANLVYNPELIKMFYKIGELMKEDSPEYFGKPVQKELTPAQILYGTN